MVSFLQLQRRRSDGPAAAARWPWRGNDAAAWTPSCCYPHAALRSSRQIIPREHNPLYLVMNILVLLLATYPADILTYCHLLAFTD